MLRYYPVNIITHYYYGTQEQLVNVTNGQLSGKLVKRIKRIERGINQIFFEPDKLHLEKTGIKFQFL